MNNIYEKEKELLYYQYLEIGIHEVLLCMCGAYSLNLQVPQTEKLVNLLPIKMIFGFYSTNVIHWKNPLTEEEHTEYIYKVGDKDVSMEKLEKKRLKAIRKINSLIHDYNIQVANYDADTPFEKRDHKKYQLQSLYWEWGLNAQLTKPSLPLVKKSEWQKNDDVLGLVNWNNELIYKKAMQIQQQEEFVPFFNKMIYEYLSLLAPVGRREEHILNKPILEFENWFMINGLSIEHTPNMIHMADDVMISSPLAQRLEQSEKDKENVTHEYSNAIKLFKKKEETLENQITQLRSKRPEVRFKELVEKNELDKLVKEQGLIHKSSGKVNWRGLGRLVSVRGKTAKIYAEKYAPYLLRDDEEGYTI